MAKIMPIAHCINAAITVLIGAIACGAASCSSPNSISQQSRADLADSDPHSRVPTPADPRPLDFPGIHNAVAFHDGFISGSAPDADTGLDTLRGMGVRTIISVDGAVPEVDKARARGMRYVHLPIGYNGFDEHRRLQLARAARDALALGPVYIHCHHGKHRSAAAAASIAANLGWASPEQGVARMKVAGTAPNYTGLYACALGSARLDGGALNAATPLADLPEVWSPSGFVQGMLEIDETFDRLKSIERAGWRTPSDHPDLVPVAEAARLADLYRALLQADTARIKSAELSRRLLNAQQQAQALEDALSAGNADVGESSALLGRIAASCKDCHARHRD